MQSTATWMKEKLSQLPAEKTAVFLVDHTEVADLPQLAHLKDSQDFMQDLALSKTYWLYCPETKRRTLLVQQKLKADSKDDAVRKEMRSLGAAAVGALHAKKVDDVEILVSEKISADHVGVFYNSVYLSNYEFTQKCQEHLDEEKKEEEDVDPRTKRINKAFSNFNLSAANDKHFDSEDFNHQKYSAQATEWARNLANTRGSEADPAYMEQKIREIVEGRDNVKELRVLDHNKLQELGMMLFYNVGKGAACQPRCVVVHYEGNPESKDIDVALVGKGITYDTGGLNIKQTGFMEKMYGDKGGACAIAGALHGTLNLKPKKNIVFAFAFADNAIGKDAYKPSDIIKSMKGLTVEIGNTDAEGRLVLADTMTYVQREFKPKKLMDLATLTGACMIALGLETAGLFTMDDDFAKELEQSAKRSFEPIWRMPIADEHRQTMKGEWSDLCNIGKTRFGGASQAAAFLERFVEKGVTWAHLDIAGPAMATVAKPPLCSDNTGFGAALLIDFLLQ